MFSIPLSSADERPHFSNIGTIFPRKALRFSKAARVRQPETTISKRPPRRARELTPSTGVRGGGKYHTLFIGHSCGASLNLCRSTPFPTVLVGNKRNALIQIATALGHPQPHQVIDFGASLLEDLRTRGIILGVLVAPES